MKRVGSTMTAAGRTSHEDRVNLYAGFRSGKLAERTFDNGRQLEPVMLHLDIDCFFAQVEQIDHPEWRGLPVIVGGRKILVRENEDEVVQGTKENFRQAVGMDGLNDAGGSGRRHETGSGTRVYGRGVVCTSSYEARARGVRTAMPMAQAVALCPEAICVRGNYQRYAEVSKAVFEVVREFSPLVRMASLDEAYLDITGLERWTRKIEGKIFGSIWVVESGIRRPILEITSTVAWPIILALALKGEIHRRTGIMVSIGIGPNTFVAKVGSAGCKPNGLLYVRAEEAGEFARRLPVRAVPGVGEVTTKRLERFGITTLDDVLKMSLPEVVSQLGNLGRMLHERALGRGGSGILDSSIEPAPSVDDSPGAFVRSASPLEHRNRRSMSRETTFNEDISDRGHLLSVLGYLTERVGWALRREGLKAGCISVKLRFADFTTLSGDRTLASRKGGVHFTDLDDEIYAMVCTLFGELLGRRGDRKKSRRGQPAESANVEPVRLIGVRLSHLSDHADRQWGFEEADTLERRQRLLKAADTIRDRFGFGSVALGRSINLIDNSSESGVGRRGQKGR